MKEPSYFAPADHQHPQPSQPSAGPGVGVIATVLVLLVGLIALQVMSLQQSSDALTATYDSQQSLTNLIQARTEKALVIAQEALVMAEAARPDPYTGADAREDQQRALTVRATEHAALKEDMDRKIALAEARTNVKLAAMEIPPASVRRVLSALTREGIRNAKSILVLSLALEHVDPKSQHVKTLSMLNDQSHDVIY